MYRILNKSLKVKTPSGYQEFIGIRKLEKESLEIKTLNYNIKVSIDHVFIVNGNRIKALDLFVGFELETIDGLEKVIDIKNIGIIDVYDLLDVKGGHIYYTNNILSHNCEFLGSSSTLISGDSLKRLIPISDDEILFDTLFEGLRIFEEPKPNHHYIITCDPKKAGLDAAAIQVVDVTNLPFVQVATVQLDESYLIIPGRLFDLGNYYNQGLVVCENNVAESIPSTLFYNYEYEGEVFIEKDIKGRPKKEMGFRTTVKTKRLGLTILKKFIEEGNLVLNDKNTIDELFNFIEHKKGNYAAEEGMKDDTVMALMLIFAPFLDFKNFDNFKGFITYLDKVKANDEADEEEFAQFLDLGFGPNDLSEDEQRGFTSGLWKDYNSPSPNYSSFGDDEDGFM